MRIKTLYIRFYKSFNYDYLRKSHPQAKPHPWDVFDGDKFYPFVSIPMERGITTVVGANESGKSQTLSAIKCLLTGEGIQRKDFCRYSTFFSVSKDMAVPEFGGEFTDLTSEEATTIRSLAGLNQDSAVESFCLFRFNRRNVLYVRHGGGWAEHELKVAEAKQISLPTYFEINANIPLPDSVPIDYLTDTRVAKSARPRKQALRLVEEFRDVWDNFGKKPDTAEQFASTLAARLTAGAGDDADDHLAARLKLAEDLLTRVAGIDRSAFEELAKAVKNSEGYANGLVSKMNVRLAEALNFPKWWSQDSEFSLYLTLRDFDLVFTVRDRTGSDYSFGERSGGMSYFLSYFVQYLSHVHPGGQEILLMDEPDAYLSTMGQQDLLGIFDSFAAPEDPTHNPVQVVYVTHSPFLIDKNHGERIRVLEKGDGEEGTRVVSNAARNHYEPLRSAFGAFVAETTFISNCNLMLEGSADQVLLAGISSMSRRLGTNGETLDLNTLSLVPSGGAEHIPYMVYLATGRDVDTPAITVLLDGDKEADGIAAELKRGYRDRRLIDDDFIIQTSDLDLTELDVDVDSVREMEDLLPAGVALLALYQFATEVLSEPDAKKFVETLTEIKVKTGDKVFKTAQVAATDTGAALDGPAIRLDKVGFARAVLRVLDDEANADLRARTLKNFEVLFRHINTAKRSAERKNTRERTTKTMNRLRRNFLKDHPTGARRRDVQELLENIIAQLQEGPEAEKIRDDVRAIRADFKVTSEPATPVENYDDLKQRLEALTYAPVVQVQETAPV